ncbi:MAG: MFS transporter, partial [Gammaproteobacteria bacterium]|nr:MFS transporter [Gammaproteobacteria bacterium]
MHTLLPVTALLLGVAILITGHGLQGVLLPVRGSLEGFSTFEIGMVGSCYFAGFGAGCLYGASLVKNVGHIRTFTAMTAIASSTALAHAFFLEPALWWLLRAGSGFCFAVLYMVIESWLNER